VSSAVLSDRLLDLEREDLVSLRRFMLKSLRVEYRLTPQAKELEIILKDLGKWADRWKTHEIQARSRLAWMYDR